MKNIFKNKKVIIAVGATIVIAIVALLFFVITNGKNDDEQMTEVATKNNKVTEVATKNNKVTEENTTTGSNKEYDIATGEDVTATYEEMSKEDIADTDSTDYTNKKIQGGGEKFSPDKVKGIILNAGSCDLCIDNSLDDNYRVESNNQNVEYNLLEDGTLQIYTQFTSEEETEEKNILTVLLPSNTYLDNFWLVFGEEVNLELKSSCTIGEFRMESYIGADVQIDNLNAYSADLQLYGFGSTNITGNVSDLNILMANESDEKAIFNYTGYIAHDSAVNVIGGECNLNLNNENNYFNTEMTISNGEVTVGGKTYSDDCESEKVDNDSLYDMKVDCTNGKVVLAY